MYLQLQEKINRYYKLSEEESVKIELASISDFTAWTRKTYCRFHYVYCNNALNRKLGRVGLASGTRYGTRNTNLIPTSKRPTKRSSNPKILRYFDTGRVINAAGKNTTIRDEKGKYTKNNGDLKIINGNWRSFRTNCFVEITGVWHPQLNKFVKVEDYKIYTDEELKNKN